MNATTQPAKSALSESQRLNLLEFIHGSFDSRLKIALTDQVFNATSQIIKHKRAQIWLQHYSKIAYNLLPKKPLFEKAYPEIIRLFAEESKYYCFFKKDKIKI